jgi:hypothetical protein
MRRFARHTMLAEIGARGQTLLEASRVELSGDPRACAAARLYLERAGVGIGGAEVLDLPDEAAVARLAGAADLEIAAAFLAGAFAAVEHVKRTVSVGAHARLPEDVALSGIEERR